jgi:hypothetical protein
LENLSHAADRSKIPSSGRKPLPVQR